MYTIFLDSKDLETKQKIIVSLIFATATVIRVMMHLSGTRPYVGCPIELNWGNRIIAYTLPYKG